MSGVKTVRRRPGTLPRHPLFLFLCLLGASALAGCATGEWAADIYVGPNFPRDEDVTVKQEGASESGTGDYEGEWTFGGRCGRWFGLGSLLDLGIFLDASGVWQEIGGFNVLSVPITALPMARIPLLRGEEFPHGRLHPYLGVGPSLVITDIDQSIMNDTSTDPGLDMRAGASFMIFRQIGVFSEYRLTYSEADFRDTIEPVGRRKIEADLLMHHILFGVALRF